jgi:hypothetical protein
VQSFLIGLDVRIEPQTPRTLEPGKENPCTWQHAALNDAGRPSCLAMSPENNVNDG